MRDWFRRMFGKSAEIHEEIESHLRMRAELNADSGLSPEAAQLAAQRQFGNVALIEEDVRRVHALPWLGSVGQDVRYAFRGFTRAPLFTMAAVLTIALGIGASTAVFSVVDRILFRPLPYPDADRLVSVGLLSPVADVNEFLMASAFLDFRDRQTPFASLASFGFISDCDLSEAQPVRLRCARVDAAFLPTFGIQPLAGRNFTAEEDRANAPVALASYGFWMSRFAGDPAAIGRTIAIDGQTVTLIGVLPRDFELFNLSPTDLLMPEALARNQEGRAVRAFARLKPGVSAEQARAAMLPLVEPALASFPPMMRQGLGLVVRPLRDRQIWTVRTASWSLFGAVMLILFMACANVANLILARSAAREREMSIRRALGAGRARLARQAITESLLLAGMGAVAGCLLAGGLLRFFVAIAPNGITRLDQAALDARVLGFAVVLTVACGTLFGLAPALRTGGSRGAAWLRHGLITAQVAASVVLLTGAGLLLRTLWSLERVPLGLDADHAVAGRVMLRKTMPLDRAAAFFQRLEERLNQLPGVQSAIASTIPPYGGVGMTPYSALNVEGRARLPEGEGGGVAWRRITPGYFAALGVPVLRGRTFTDADRTTPGGAIVLSQLLARRLFGSEDPIGKRVFQSDGGRWHTVVGIAGDVHNDGLTGRIASEYYVVAGSTAAEGFNRSATVVVRSPFEAQAAAGMLRATVAELDSTLPVEVETLDQRVGRLKSEPRFHGYLLAGFAAIGLVLAAIGIYGVVAFLVSQRSREVGVRMALGALPSGIARMFVLRAARWTASGVLFGLAGALAATRLLRGALFGVPERDVWSFAAAAALLCLVSLAAAWKPSRRAARIDPARVLRGE